MCRLGSVDSGQNILSRTFCPELFIVSSNLFTSHRHCGCPTGVYHRLTTPFRKWCRPPARRVRRPLRTSTYPSLENPYSVGSKRFLFMESLRRTTSALLPRGLVAPLGRITCKPMASVRDEACGEPFLLFGISSCENLGGGAGTFHHP